MVNARTFAFTVLGDVVDTDAADVEEEVDHTDGQPKAALHLHFKVASDISLVDYTQTLAIYNMISVIQLGSISLNL